MQLMPRPFARALRVFADGVRPSCAAAVLVAAAIGMGAEARAEDSPGADQARVLVIPLTGSGGGTPDAATAFTRAIARVAAIGNTDVIEADATLADAAAVAGCEIETEGCLDEIAASLGVSELVFGQISEATDGGIAVSLTYHRQGDTRTHSFTVAAGPLAEQSRVVGREAAGLLAGEEPAPESKPAREPKPASETKPAPQPVAPPDKLASSTLRPQPASSARRDRGVRPLSWSVLGAGVAVAGAGAVFLALARDRQKQVDDAPANTPSDFTRLLKLEDEGERYAKVGGGLLAVGGAAVAAGIVLIVLDAKSSRSSRRSTVAVTPVPYPGGGVVAVTVELP